MAADPAALQLRLLQTVVEVAAEKNSTLVMPVPVELLRFFDRAAIAGSGPARPLAEDAEDRGALPAPAKAPPVPQVTVPEAPALTMPASLATGTAQNAPLNASLKTPAVTA